MCARKSCSSTHAPEFIEREKREQERESKKSRYSKDVMNSKNRIKSPKKKKVK